MKNSLKVFLAVFSLFLLFGQASVFAEGILDGPTATAVVEFRDAFLDSNTAVAEGFGIILLILFFYAIYFVALSRASVFTSAKPARIVISAVLAIFSTFGLVRLVGKGSEFAVPKLAQEILALLFLFGVLYLVFRFIKAISAAEIGVVLKVIMYILVFMFAYSAIAILGEQLFDATEIFGAISGFLAGVTFLGTLFGILLLLLFVVAPIVLIIWGLSKLFGGLRREQENSDAERVRYAIEEIDEESAKVDALMGGIFDFIKERERQMTRSRYSSATPPTAPGSSGPGSSSRRGTYE